MKFQRINNRKPMTTEKKSEKQNNDDEMVKFVRKKYTFNIKKPELGIRMYNIIFKHKYVPSDHFYLKNLFGNLKFYLPHVVEKDKKEFEAKIEEYRRLCKETGFTETNA